MLSLHFVGDLEIFKMQHKKKASIWHCSELRSALGKSDMQIFDSVFCRRMRGKIAKKCVGDFPSKLLGIHSETHIYSKISDS